MSPSLRVEDLSVGYSGELVLKDLSFSFHGPGLLQILGPNGAGKTTLIKTILGLLRPVKGRIMINGEDVTGKPSLAGKYIGYTPQLSFLEAYNYPITLWEVVEYCLLLRKKWPRMRAGKRDRRRIEEVLGLVGLPRETWSKRFIELSGGQKQRGLVARALVSDPEILVLDEPFSSVDPQGRVDLARIIGELSREKLIIVTSHDPTLLLKYTKKILMVNKWVYVYGDPDEVLSTEQAGKIYGSGIIEVRKHVHILDSHA